MKRHTLPLGIAALLVAAIGLTAPLAPAQDKALEGIAGDYLMDFGNRTLPFTVILKDAKLFFDAGIPGQEPQPMTPVSGKELTFASIDPNGDDVTFVFVLNAQKKITGCKISVPAQGAEAEARKVEKK